MRRSLWSLAAWALLAAGPSPARAGYLITDLGRGTVNGLNNAGQVVGYSVSTDGTLSAFLYGGGSRTALGTLGGPFSNATAVNDAGQVVGYAATASGAAHAFLYSGGVMHDLNVAGGTTDSFAYAVNASGQVAGSYGSGFSLGFVYSGGVTKGLGTLGVFQSIASGLNASGQVVGWAYIPGGSYHAFLSTGGHMTDLGTLGGPNSAATAINAAGQVVGYSGTPYGYQQAFLYEGGKMQGLAGPGNSSALAINDRGQIVGAFGADANLTHAFLYSGGRAADLNGLVPAGFGVVLTSAVGINGQGQIAAQGSDGHGYLLTPDGVAATPEPSALALLAFGSAGLLGRAGLRRARAARHTAKEVRA
jgi:probable HAF family extracellular repeat protein